MELDESLRARARRAYEAGRARSALRVALPTAAIALIAAVVGRAAGWALAFGGALFLTTALFAWRGQDFGRGARVGVLAGILPFVAIVSVHLGILHTCTGGHCYSVCLATCVAAGTLAGLGVGVFVARTAHPVWAWVSAAAVTALTGALGCAYLGAPGVLALASSVAAASLLCAIVLRRLPRNRRSARPEL